MMAAFQIQGETSDMPNQRDKFPLLIGITGRRAFRSASAENDAIRRRISNRLAMSFRYISDSFPHAPKVVLTGGAYGTDLLAAEAALAVGKEWSVAVVLPYAVDFFEKDFRLRTDHPGDVPEVHSDIELFRRRLTESAGFEARRVTVRVLPPLRTADGDPAVPDDLDKDIKPHDDVLRRAHYEQVGQFIAETAMLLIAVMDPGDQVDSMQANGSTARIVAFRRAGQPDHVGADVARRGTVTRRDWSTVLRPAGGYVWLMDPNETGEIPSPPVTVLPPLTDRAVELVYQCSPGCAMPRRDQPESQCYRTIATIGSRWKAGRRLLYSKKALVAPAFDPRVLHESLHPLRAFDDFEALHRRRPDAPRVEARAKPDPASLADIPDPVEYLADLRTLIRWPQSYAKKQSERAFLWVCWLFVTAVVALEIFAKFLPQYFQPLLVYLVCLLAIVVKVFLARLHLWQPRSEDYRAVSEMLRVQRAWWAAGVAERVDRVHLQGVEAELARPRDAVRSILGWIELRSNWHTTMPIPPSWEKIRVGDPNDAAKPRCTEDLVGPDAPRPADWIGEQIRYYAENYKERADMAARYDTLTWLLFTTSGVLALIVCDWLFKGLLGFEVESQKVFSWMADQVTMGRSHPLAVSLWFLLTAGTLAGRWCLRNVEGWLAVLLTGLAGLLCGVGLAVILQALGGPFMFWLEELSGMPLHHVENASDMSERLAVLVFVGLTATAGALRFYSEKRGFEAEAFAYRDALDKFVRAERAFAALADPASGAPRDSAAAGKLVFELGSLAMRENESWLKAHRERPLSPVVG